LRRFNTVAEGVLGDRSPCALLIHECGVASKAELRGYGLVADSISALGELPQELWDEEGVFAVPMCISGAATIWLRGVFDRFFAGAAQDRLRGLLVELQRGQVFARYNGGADLFFSSSWERDQAKERYFSWISQRTDGPVRAKVLARARALADLSPLRLGQLYAARLR
jgi:hypothetical protein